MDKNNAKITDPNMLIQMGIDPKTGLPIKFVSNDAACISKEAIFKQLTVVDRQDAIRRYKWYNLYPGLTQEIIERVLYYRGQGVLFNYNDKFYFLPYALDGTIDVYGRFESITPLIFGGSSDGNDKPWIKGKSFKPVYEPLIPDDYVEKSDEELERIIDTSCVILKDYTEGIAQTIAPRSALQTPLLELMSEMPPFLRTALLNSTGVRGVKTSSEDENAQITAAASAITRAALSGKPYVGVIGALDFQELTNGGVGTAEEFLLAMQSLDNYRLSLYGLSNGGLFQKKSHILEAEQAVNDGNVGLIALDGLELRRQFCTVANSIWGGDMWVETSETVLNVDVTGDGIADDDTTNIEEGGENDEM